VLEAGTKDADALALGAVLGVALGGGAEGEGNKAIGIPGYLQQEANRGKVSSRRPLI
jgi:hypothetical protein